ncbi:thioredoxin family protein [Xanthomonas phage RTH11]|nr:thioredoxin family protein [Xanthomonas phage RTH11]
MEITKLTSIDALNAFTADNTNALVIVSRNACAGCNALDGALKTNVELQAALAGTAVALVKLEDVPDIARTFGLRMAPSMLLFKEDDEVARLLGFEGPAKLLAALRANFCELAEAA